MADARVYGIRISYSESGKGKPVLFLHEVGGDRTHFFPQIEALKSKYRCVTPDLPGHGQSGKIFVDHSVIFSAEIMLGFVKETKLKAPTIIGHGFGAAVALEMAYQAADLVGDVILLSPPPLVPNEQIKTLANDMEQALDSSSARTKVASFIRDNVLTDQDDAKTRDIVVKSMAMVPGHVLASAVASASEYELKRPLRAVDGRLACLNGTRHNLSRNALQGQIADAEYGEIMMGTHFLQLTQNEQVNTALETCLKAFQKA